MIRIPTKQAIDVLRANGARHLALYAYLILGTAPYYDLRWLTDNPVRYN